MGSFRQVPGCLWYVADRNTHFGGMQVITGEAKPTKGEVEKHPNLRIAYIAQHAFHHLEAHLTETPVQYIMRRYEHGEDEEEAEKVPALLFVT